MGGAALFCFFKQQWPEWQSFDHISLADRYQLKSEAENSIYLCRILADETVLFNILWQPVSVFCRFPFWCWNILTSLPSYWYIPHLIIKLENVFSSFLSSFAPLFQKEVVIDALWTFIACCVLGYVDWVEGQGWKCTVLSEKKVNGFQVGIFYCMVKSFLRAILGTRDIIPISLIFFLFYLSAFC